MAEFQIPIDSLTSLKDKVVLITGSASGIGKATVKLALQLGAKVIAGDINPLPDNFVKGQGQEAPGEEPPTWAPESLFFQQTDVSKWDGLRDLFIKSIERFGRIDHVFANAGIGPRSNFLEETFEDTDTKDSDEKQPGLLAPPDLRVLDVNLISVIYTVRLGIYYLRRSASNLDKESRNSSEEDSTSPSITITASASSFQDFAAADYTVAKHGVLGILRGLCSDLQTSNSESLEPEKRRGVVRLNAIAPSWTRTGLVDGDILEGWGIQVQEPEAVARSVLMLFIDGKRHGEVIYSWGGRYCEINKGEGGLLENAARILPNIGEEGAVMERLRGR